MLPGGGLKNEAAFDFKRGKGLLRTVRNRRWSGCFKQGSGCSGCGPQSLTKELSGTPTSSGQSESTNAAERSARDEGSTIERLVQTQRVYLLMRHLTGLYSMQLEAGAVS